MTTPNTSVETPTSQTPTIINAIGKTGVEIMWESIKTDNRKVPSIAELTALTGKDKCFLAGTYAKIGLAVEKAKGIFVDKIHEMGKFLFVIEPDANALGKTLASHYRYLTGVDRKPEHRAEILKNVFREYVPVFFTEKDFDAFAVDGLIKVNSLTKKGVDKNVIAKIVKERTKDAMKDLRALDPDVDATAAPATIEDHVKVIADFVAASDADKLQALHRQLGMVLKAIEDKAGETMVEKWFEQDNAAELATEKANIENVKAQEQAGLVAA